MQPSEDRQARAPLLQHQTEYSSDPELTVEMEDHNGEARQENFVIQFVASTTVGLSVTMLVATAVVTLTAVIIHKPFSVTDKEMIIEPLLWIASLYYCSIMVLMAIQVLLMKSEGQRFNIITKDYNKFLLSVVLIIFLPTSEAYLIFRIITNICMRLCLNSVRIVHSFVEALFIPTVAIYTLKMSGKGISGTRTLVIVIKITVAIVVITCLCKWIYLAITDAAEDMASIWDQGSTDMAQCHLNNATINVLKTFSTWSHYLYPFMSELALSCSALLYGTYHNSKVDVTRPYNPENEHHHPRLTQSQSPLRNGSIPIIISLILFVLCLVQLAINSMANTIPITTPIITYLGFTAIPIILMYVIIISVTGIMLLQMPQTIEQPIEIPADRVLLWISTVGPISRAVFHFEGSLILFQTNATTLDFPGVTKETVGVDFTIYILLFVQVFLQSLVLDISLRRRIDDVKPTVKMFRPALILIVANFGLWIDITYTPRGVYLSPIYEHYLGEKVWNVINCICRPLYSLQKIHSASLLYKIYKAGA